MQGLVNYRNCWIGEDKRVAHRVIWCCRQTRYPGTSHKIKHFNEQSQDWRGWCGERLSRCSHTARGVVDFISSNLGLSDTKTNSFIHQHTPESRYFGRQQPHMSQQESRKLPHSTSVYTPYCTRRYDGGLWVWRRQRYQWRPWDGYHHHGSLHGSATYVLRLGLHHFETPMPKRSS